MFILVNWRWYSNDKNFTVTSKLFVNENPLFIGEYHQAFANSNFLTDFGYTEGYKNTSRTKKAGEKSHFFSKFIKNVINESIFLKKNFLPQLFPQVNTIFVFK